MLVGGSDFPERPRRGRHERNGHKFNTEAGRDQTGIFRNCPENPPEFYSFRNAASAFLRAWS